MRLHDLIYAAKHHERIDPLPVASHRRRLRQDCGVSQELAAVAVGASVTALARWETSERAPRLAKHDDQYRRVLGALANYVTYKAALSVKASGR